MSEASGSCLEDWESGSLENIVVLWYAVCCAFDLVSGEKEREILEKKGGVSAKEEGAGREFVCAMLVCWTIVSACAQRAYDYDAGCGAGRRCVFAAAFWSDLSV